MDLQEQDRLANEVNRLYAASIAAAARHALAGEILLVLIRQEGSADLERLGAKARTAATLIYPLEMERLAMVPPPAAAREGIETVFDAKPARDHREMEGMRQADPMALRAQQKDHR